MFQSSLKKLSHHAYCLIGGNSVKDQLIIFLNKEHSIPIQGNADFFEKKYEIFTIEDAHALKTAHETRPVKDEGKKIFIVSADNLTIEAQNALLKLLEEPAEYAHFFLIVPEFHLLLPTVKSRLMLVELGKSLDDDYQNEMNEQAKKFISLPLAKRLEMIKKILDDISKEKKTKQYAVDFLNSIQAEIYGDKKTDFSKDKKEKLDQLIATETARKYISDRAPSLKMLLEYVALNV